MRTKVTRLWAVIVAMALPLAALAQDIDTSVSYYLMHSSGNHLAKGSDNAVLEAPDATSPQTVKFIAQDDGTYVIQATDGTYLAKGGLRSWNTQFVDDPTDAQAQVMVEEASTDLIKIKFTATGKYLGTDSNDAGASVFSDKAGTDTRHYWYLATNPTQEEPQLKLTYLVSPAARRQSFEGWGISLCWWANMCGKWSDEKIDEIVDWLVSPQGLNYRIFRYNIGGGDDPENKNCTPHHMGSGKGLRAEMEGFKDSLNGEYIWTRDEAQRKIMLKIKEKRPDAIFEAFSNSAPYWMTYSGCVAGNTSGSKDNLKPEYYEAFAHYLVDVCKHYKDEYGIEFRTLSPFNEPMTSYWGADGGQEGCHFDVASQIAFLKVLSPILKASGLNTVIAASEETSIPQSVSTFDGYRDADVLSLVGQWNTHSYTATQKSRCQISAYCGDAGIRLWMSEVGASGSGIGGNLNLAQRLMHDIRYIMPSAWVDWQYIEEANDQWCLVRGNFEDQSYYKVKNYYVRQQFTRFIKPSYTFLTSTSEQTLAATNPAADTLIIVAINPTGQVANHTADLSFYKNVGSDITAYRTSETEDLATVQDFTLREDTLTYKLQPYSIITFVVPVEERSDFTNTLKDGGHYWIMPRNTANFVAKSYNGVLVLADREKDAAQVWEANAVADGYTFSNANGDTISYTSAYALTTSPQGSTSSVFNVTPVDQYYWKICSNEASPRAFDLENEGNSAWTHLGLWSFGTTPNAIHRQWTFVALPSDALPDMPSSLSDTKVSPQVEVRFVTGEEGTLTVEHPSCTDGRLTLYTSAGVKFCSHNVSGYVTRIPLPAGLYIAEFKSHAVRSVKVVLVR